MKNYAKKVLMILVALLPCLQMPVTASAEPSNIPVTPFPRPGGGGTRPRAMARFPRTIDSMPDCYYWDGIVGIEAETDITYISASVTRLDDGEEWSNEVFGNELTLSVSEEPGTYLLLISLSNGNSYYGEYTLE